MPTGFYIGPLYIYFYGIILMLGALAGGWLASTLAKRRGYDPDLVWDALIWALIGGIIGARLWHIFTPTQSLVDQGITTGWYLTHPLDAINIRRGGLGIPGAVIGGAIAVFFFCRHRKFPFLPFADFAAPALALAQAIGRWGNFVNQEVYGAPTNLPWAVHIEPQYRLAQFASVETYHPLFLYESIWNLINLGVLLWLGQRYKSKLKDGDIFLTYLVIYPVGRFFLEFLRLDASMVGGINANQIFMAIVAVCAGAALFLRHRNGSASKAEPIEAVDMEQVEARQEEDPGKPEETS